MVEAETDRDNPDFQKLSNMDSKFEGLEKLFTKVLDDYRGSSRVYYSWLFLYIFYYLKGVSPDTIATFGKNMPDAEAPQNKLFSAKLRYELKSASFPLDMSGNTFVKRADFSLYLEVFHQDFIGWLSKSADESAKVLSEPQTEVELSFDSEIYPKVKLLTGEEYTFSYMKPKALKIIKHCYNNPGIPVGTDKFPTIDFQGKGIVNALRGTKFYPEHGVLSVFLTVQGRPAKVTLRRRRNLDDTQLQQLIDKAAFDSTNSQ